MKIPFGKRVARTDIDMVPMINFAFLLLIFFMLVGTLSPRELFSVRPPYTEAGNAAADDGSRVLIVTADGLFALGSEPLTAAELPARLARWAQEHPGEVMQVKADAGLDAARVVEVLETLRSAGIARVTLLAIHRQ